MYLWSMFLYFYTNWRTSGEVRQVYKIHGYVQSNISKELYCISMYCVHDMSWDNIYIYYRVQKT